MAMTALCRQRPPSAADLTATMPDHSQRDEEARVLVARNVRLERTRREFVLFEPEAGTAPVTHAPVYAARSVKVALAQSRRTRTAPSASAELPAKPTNHAASVESSVAEGVVSVHVVRYSCSSAASAPADALPKENEEVSEVQAGAPGAANEPAPQGVHVMSPTALVQSRGQLAHTPLVRACPAGQLPQALAPTALVVPLGQLTH